MDLQIKKILKGHLVKRLKKINDIVKEYDYPVCFNFPVSHEKENYALKIGVTYQLSVKKIVRLRKAVV